MEIPMPTAAAQEATLEESQVPLSWAVILAPRTRCACPLWPKSCHLWHGAYLSSVCVTNWMKINAVNTSQ
eukprot:scaffold190587_cov22-Tisochrysis_lutea.AAC.1